ncbi:MAG: adenylate kinase [Marinilabiliaceae bacterium]|nr:adenylate kinase [Marinilabiliaceae bacterium]
MLNVVIFGPPGSGKGTQSQKIIEKYGLTHISTGDLLRREIHTNTHLGVIAKSYIDRGELVPDETIIEMLDHFMDNLPKVKGIIFDGFPRTVIQAEAFQKMLKNNNTSLSVMLNLEVDRQELIDRLLLRGETSGRSDDNLETITKRLEVYENRTSPVISFYKEVKLYQAIKGMGSVDEIFQGICTVLDKHLEQ